MSARQAEAMNACMSGILSMGLEWRVVKQSLPGEGTISGWQPASGRMVKRETVRRERGTPTCICTVGEVLFFIRLALSTNPSPGRTAKELAIQLSPD